MASERVFQVNVVGSSILVMEHITAKEGDRPAFVPTAAGSPASCAATMKGIFAAMVADANPRGK